MEHSVITQRELEIQKLSDFENLFEWQMKDEGRTTKFVLHDGPPYANGPPHVGHALNKILKDITNRYKLLQGYRVHYKPGWDCHGMPIEHKVMQQNKLNRAELLDPIKIRKKANDFANESSQIQKESFVRWGVMANWNDCYKTSDKSYETEQIDCFFNLYEKGIVYQDYMPVFWSPSSRTALAESEVEYVENYSSTQIIFKFPILRHSEHLEDVGPSCNLYALIWTTTPWTLPFNQAICFGKNINYCLVKDEQQNFYLLSKSYLDSFAKLINSNLKEISQLSGSTLKDWTYRGTDNIEKPFLSANHVTAEKGTGLVHAAPAHGIEDFQVGIKNNLSLICGVDEEGKFMDSLGKDLKGKFVLTEGQNKVLELFSGSIIHKAQYIHSYPHDWRDKKPLIFRASHQWFFDTKKIKDLALSALENVTFLPNNSNASMLSQIKQRDYWCISRQRSWGVPIPAFYKINDNSTFITKSSIDHLKKLFIEHGSDCWWSLPLKSLLPADIKQEIQSEEVENFYRKGKDVLDIWFDSGISWASILKDLGCSSDLYLEGLDQYGGWFQSSLLTSVALQKRAPYKSLLVHGFAVDEKGQKMSKSMGNVVDPNQVINGADADSSKPAYGVDVLRLWVAHVGYAVAVPIGPSLLREQYQKLFRIRKSLRYLMANLYDFDLIDKKTKDYKLLYANDKYMLHLLYLFSKDVTRSYEEYNYSRAIKSIDKFISNQVSTFYCHIVKDRLYCGDIDSRRSIQIVLYHLLDVISKSIAPILPHLAEEVYLYQPLKSIGKSIFRTRWHSCPDEWQNVELGQIYEVIFSLRYNAIRLVGLKKPEDFVLNISSEDLRLVDILKVLDENKNGHNSRVSMNTSLSEFLQFPLVTINSSNSSQIEFTLQNVFHCLPCCKEDLQDDSMSYKLQLSQSPFSKCSRCRLKLAYKSKHCPACQMNISQ